MKEFISVGMIKSNKPMCLRTLASTAMPVRAVNKIQDGRLDLGTGGLDDTDGLQLVQ